MSEFKFTFELLVVDHDVVMRFDPSTLRRASYMDKPSMHMSAESAREMGENFRRMADLAEQGFNAEHDKAGSA